MPADLFDISTLASSALTRAALTAARPLLDRILGLTALSRLYRTVPEAPPEQFPGLALAALRISGEVSHEALARIPAAGPVIVVANHPHGALDGLVLAALVRRVRPDVKLLANHWLAAIPALAQLCCFVDPFGGPQAAVRSRAGLREAHLWLRQGGVLIAFPAGEVAPRLDTDGQPLEGAWATTIGRLALMTGASLCPAFIEGRNSRRFYRAGRVHAWLRTALLARELLAQAGSVVRVRFGQIVPRPADAAPADNTRDDAAARWIASARLHALALASPDQGAPHTHQTAVMAEVAALPAAARLLSAGDFEVYCATADRIPAVLQEIGRLREVTFRAVGEGTGLALDLDRFDLTYRHLFLWNRRARHIVGAYRLGCVDQLVDTQGLAGLYTSTLFTYDRTLLSRLGPAIELGRSFIREEYQRHHSVLLLLWRGICAFVARHPHYRVLFGPVSISARYPERARALMLAYLQAAHGDAQLAPLVRAQQPPLALMPPSPSDHIRRDGADDDANAASASAASAGITSVDAANRAVVALSGGQGMPVLLRHYLKLGGRVLGFNVDPQFSDALDALLYVNLDTVDPVLLNRYFGDEGAGRFRASATGVVPAAVTVRAA